MTHEISHMFGIKHCIYYECLMNGSNKITESDIKPPRLCAVCMRKLKHMVQFNYKDHFVQTQYLLLDVFIKNPFFDSYREFLNEFIPKLEDDVRQSVQEQDSNDELSV
jgi:hypothetical protein